MMVIKPPPRADNYSDRALDCEFAIEPAFQALARQAEAAGWSVGEVAAALLSLGGAHIKGIMEDRKTGGALSKANGLTSRCVREEETALLSN